MKNWYWKWNLWKQIIIISWVTFKVYWRKLYLKQKQNTEKSTHIYNRNSIITWFVQNNSSSSISFNTALFYLLNDTRFCWFQHAHSSLEIVSFCTYTQLCVARMFMFSLVINQKIAHSILIHQAPYHSYSLLTI
jgi:hypothetical protein